jgi:hypothetical protein
MRAVGIALLVLGFVGLIWGGIPYKKTENVAEIGGLKMQVTEKKQMTIAPWLSGIAILGGAVLIVRGRRSA